MPTPLRGPPRRGPRARPGPALLHVPTPRIRGLHAGARERVAGLRASPRRAAPAPPTPGPASGPRPPARPAPPRPGVPGPCAAALTARTAASRRRPPRPAGTPTACAGRAGSRSRRPDPPGRPSSRSAAARSARSTASPTGGPGLPPPPSPSYARPAATAATASAAATANGTRWEAAPGRGPAYGHPLPSPGPPSRPARLSRRPGLLPAHLAFPPTSPPPPPPEPRRPQVGPGLGSTTPTRAGHAPSPAAPPRLFAAGLTPPAATPLLEASFSLLEAFLPVQ